MKYVYDKEVKKSVPASAIVRIIFGTICFVLFVVFMVSSISEAGTGSDDFVAFLVFGILSAIGAFFLLFFGVRALLKSGSGVATKNPYQPVPYDANNPFFTVVCPTCATKFDYQKSDLGYRAWFPNGYVVCPICKKPIRHNAVTNAYNEEN